MFDTGKTPGAATKKVGEKGSRGTLAFDARNRRCAS